MSRIPQNRWGLPARMATATSFAAALALAVWATIGLAAPSSLQAPTNTAPPTISGTAQVGQVLTANNGTWTGTGTITYTYQWLRCDSAGNNCAAISGATAQTYTATTADVGNTLRVDVTATDGVGSTTARSAQTAPVAAATTPPPSNGCPAQTTGTAPISELSLPAQLQIVHWQVTSGRLTKQTRRFTLQVRVGSTCRVLIRGASVYVTAVPFNQFSVPAERLTGNGGVATLTFTRRAGFPASPRQRLLTFFIRARNPAENVLRGVTARRLVALPLR